MPGFNINDIGDGPLNNIETLRDQRWLINRMGPRASSIGNDQLLLARDLTLPKFRPEQLDIMGGVLHYKYVKGIKWEDVSVTFYDNSKIITELMNWYAQIYRGNTGGATGLGIHDDYKGVSEFSLLDGKGEVVQKVTLNGSWPSNIDFGKMSYTSSNIKIVEVTLSYDWAVFYPMKQLN